MALGATPTLLSAIGSSVAEISIIASQRPLLCLLLVFGAPAAYITRVLEYTHPLDALSQIPQALTVIHFPNALRSLKEPLQYAATMAAVANNIELALQLGSRTVLAWACRSWYMPLVWVMFPLSTLTLAFWSCYTISHRKERRGNSDFQHSSRAALKIFSSRCSQAFQAPNDFEVNPQEGPMTAAAAALQSLASLLALGHIAIGIYIFSSLIFVGFHDTLLIFARLTISAFICRIVAVLQLAGINASLHVQGRTRSLPRKTRKCPRQTSPEQIRVRSRDKESLIAVW